MEKLLSLVEEKLPLCSADEKRARSLLSALKKDLKSDLDCCSEKKELNKTGHVECQFFLPAIYEAERRISVEASSTPNQRWVDEIDIAQKYIKYYLNQVLYLKN